MSWITIMNAVMLGQVSPAQSADSPGGALQTGSVFEFLVKGGWAMIPIGACSLVALTIIIERALVLRKGRVIPRNLAIRLREAGRDRAKALIICQQDGSPMAKIIGESIKRNDEPRDVLEKHMEETGGRELVALRRNMRLLSALPQVATMLGLLGTVFGMIKTFQAIATTSESLGKTEMLAEGIFEAWTCTAAGLLVAVPVLVAYHWLMGRIDALTVEVDRTAAEWLEQQDAKPAVASHVVEVRRSPESIISDSAIPAGTPA